MDTIISKCNNAINGLLEKKQQHLAFLVLRMNIKLYVNPTANQGHDIYLLMDMAFYFAQVYFLSGTLGGTITLSLTEIVRTNVDYNLATDLR